MIGEMVSMNESNLVKSSMKNLVITILELGIVLGIILSLLDDFVLFRLYRYPFFHTIAGWPVSIVTGTAVMLLVIMLRRTTVQVTRDKIVIRKFLHKIQLPLADFDAPVIQSRNWKYWIL